MKLLSEGIHMQSLVENIYEECKGGTAGGHVATYIPELAKATPADFGISVFTADGKEYSAGKCDLRFTMQSVIKPVIFLLALIDNGYEAVRKIVGVEATGKPFDTFNYSDRALTGEHINPMVNAGAIALCSLIKGKTYEEKLERLVAFTKKLSGSEDICVDEAVYRSEHETGNKNRALGYMLKAYGLIEGEVEPLVETYFKACSISADCRELARIAHTLAMRGRLHTGEVLFPKEYARYVNAIMMISGMYDGSGEFALRVGVPSKSGVGGGIMSVIPGKMGIGIYSPALDSKGNSIAGMRALEILNERIEISIF